MKKMIMAAAIVCATAFVNAATVGWNVATGSAAYAGDAYAIFVIGQNAVTSIDTIKAILDDGGDYSSYAFGTGSIAANGTGITAASASGKMLGAGSYTAFAVLFDSATPTAGESNYAIISGAAGFSKTLTASTTTTTFSSGSQAQFLGNSANWQSYGSVPEPTSGLLLLLGVAGLALKRKVA